MRKRRNRPHHDQGRDASPARALIRYPGWKLEDAKAHFSEVVRRAQSEGPQRVTVRGKDTAVVISAVELERLLLLPQETKSAFVELMESLYVEGFNLNREPDYGRDIEVIGWLRRTAPTRVTLSKSVEGMRSIYAVRNWTRGSALPSSSMYTTRQKTGPRLSALMQRATMTISGMKKTSMAAAPRKSKVRSVAS